MIRAIYTGDVRFNECNVFEYDNQTKMFQMINDKEIAYSFETVMEDEDFIIFLTNGDVVYQMDTKNRANIEK
ncbi:hypothetical protein [Paucisalibacillus globulus]|uniref:hypothetical protein n=1 Tax=Paucisalibacillus globulus TaxID=351095 RepID=UPI000402B441|nr:hypothetical protein [Paucisalibacillus globulus]